jgi:hypothetical protein
MTQNKEKNERKIISKLKKRISCDEEESPPPLVRRKRQRPRVDHFPPMFATTGYDDASAVHMTSASSSASSSSSSSAIFQSDINKENYEFTDDHFQIFPTNTNKRNGFNMMAKKYNDSQH